jgi:hypothetical protein
MIMKRAYIHPSTSKQETVLTSIICGSGRINSDIGITGGDNSGDPSGAY